MKETLLAGITNKVQSNESMTNERYNELSKIAGNEAKMAEANATPEEVAFINEVADMKKQGTADISKTFQTLAKDYVGASEYNQIKKALKSDAALKSRYESMLGELKADDESEETETAN